MSTPMLYVTSDLHMDHEKAIALNNRPFIDLYHMQDYIFKQINDLPDGATLYVLGDFSVKDSKTNLRKLLNRIKPTLKLIWVLGNHDHRLESVFAEFGEVYKILEVKHQRRKIVMCHFPMAEWNQGQYGALHFYGHCHGRLQHHGKSVDVGWDVHKRILTVDEAMSIADIPVIFQPCHDTNNGKQIDDLEYKSY